MTYENDPNRRMQEGRSYTGWIVGAVVALAVIIGIFAMTSRNDHSSTASNSPASGSAATTTGSAPAQPNSPAPASR
jgi:hypothetical protein